MDYAAAKARTDEILSRIRIVPSEDGEGDSLDLDRTDWLTLDTVKFELAREILYEGSPAGEGVEIVEEYGAYRFEFGGGFIQATLSFDANSAEMNVAIDLVEDPTWGEADSYMGDANQAWMLFHSLDEDSRKDILDAVKRTKKRGADVLAMLTAAIPPPVGPDPFERNGEARPATVAI